jgi:hypothetical protein
MNILEIYILPDMLTAKSNNFAYEPLTSDSLKTGSIIEITNVVDDTLEINIVRTYSSPVVSIRKITGRLANRK